jgi:hypothetical protein
MSELSRWLRSLGGRRTSTGTAARRSADLSVTFGDPSGKGRSLTRRCAESVLFITLDSCRFDTFAAARAPNFKSLGPVQKAMAPGNFTYASHSAMFVGFTPGDASQAAPFINPKYSKLFKLVGMGFPGKGAELFALTGRSIVEGFNRLGYTTIGSGAAGWFDDRTATGKHLSQDFQHFWFAGNCWSLARQLNWLGELLDSTSGPVFCFLNVGETHVPYYFEGAPWSVEDNPCVPFSATNDAAKCRERQRMCLEFADQLLAPLLHAFSAGTTLVCGDHGDCWGEDGIWEHGVSHPKVLEVPLVMRIRSESARAAA